MSERRDPLLRYGIDPSFPSLGETELDHELHTLQAMSDQALLHVLRYTNMKRNLEVVKMLLMSRYTKRFDESVDHLVTKGG